MIEMQTKDWWPGYFPPINPYQGQQQFIYPADNQDKCWNWTPYSLAPIPPAPKSEWVQWLAQYKAPVPDREARLYFCIGCQRSGKSTLARRWLHREGRLPAPLYDDDGFPRFLWDTDALRLELSGKAYHHDAESVVFAVKRYAIAAALRLGHDVIVAGTHTSRSSVRRLLEIRRNAIPVVVDTPLDVCLDRAIATNQSYLLNVIPRTHAQLQQILEQGVEGFVASILRDMDEKEPY